MANQPAWTQWSQHVLSELERLNNIQEHIRTDIQKVNMDIIKLQVRAGMWGSIAGMIPAIIALTVWFLQQP